MRTKVRSSRCVLVLCVLAYTVSYLCRTNFSVAASDLSQVFHIGLGRIGMIGTVYFWAYALGQLLAGWLCTKIDPMRIVSAGLLLTGLCNMGIGFVRTDTALLLLWALNGLSLALFWPSILQISMDHTEPSRYTAVSVILNLPTTVGFLISWAGLGTLRTALQWNWMFWLPALAAFFFLIVWSIAMKPSPLGPKTGDSRSARPSAEGGVGGTLAGSLLTAAMLGYSVLVLLQGCTKESINLWAPTLLRSIPDPAHAALVPLFTSLIPIFSTGGLLLTGWLIRILKDRPEPAMLVLLAFGMLGGWSLTFLRTSALWAALSMGVLLAVTCGVSTILTTTLPLRVARRGQGGALSGFFNFLSYFGAALGSWASGAVSDRWGWSAVYLAWAVLATTGMAIMLFCIRCDRSSPQR